MQKVMIGALALVTAMVFASGNIAFSVEATPSQHHAQAQTGVPPEKVTKDEANGKTSQSKMTKKKAKKKAAKKPRKSKQPEE